VIIIPDLNRRVVSYHPADVNTAQPQNEWQVKEFAMFICHSIIILAF
jgi:hypothetical protein